MSAAHYEEQILKELHSLPQEVLPRVLQFLVSLREENSMQEKPILENGTQGTTNHAKTRQLLASSKVNWAQELITEREDRL